MGNEFIDYDYSTSFIRTNLKFDFDYNNKKYTEVHKKIYIDLKVYKDKEVIKAKSKIYKNVSVYDVILDFFYKQILTKEELIERNKNYYIIFKAFEVVPIKRYKYEKTDTKIDANRRKYLLYERINVYF